MAAGLVGLLLAVAVLGVVLYHGFAEPENRLAGGDPPHVADAFDRLDSSDELGPGWDQVSGTWGVQGGRAVLVRPDLGADVSLAVVDLGAADATVSATAAGMGPGWAVVVRYAGPSDYWMVVAAPDFGTWNVVAVEGGERRQVANLGLSPAAAGTTVTVQLRGDRLKVFLDGSFRTSVTAPAGAGATGVGLAAVGAALGRAWDDFSADAAGPVVQPVPATGASTTAPL